MLHDRIMTSIVFYPLKRSIVSEKRNENSRNVIRIHLLIAKIKMSEIGR
jgi:hypothetical protein